MDKMVEAENLPSSATSGDKKGQKKAPNLQGAEAIDEVPLKKWNNFRVGHPL